jgi:uncharacterized protein (DUF3820 family)
MKKDHVSRKHTPLPFGKYKGFYLKDVPDEYLDWAAKHWVDKQYRPILTIVIEEIADRHFNKKKEKYVK